MVYLLKMVIFHSYVKLPEGIYDPGPRSRSPPPPPPNGMVPHSLYPRPHVYTLFADHDPQLRAIFAAFGWCQALFVGYSQAFGISDSLFAGF